MASPIYYINSNHQGSNHLIPHNGRQVGQRALQLQIACIHSWMETLGRQDRDKKTRYIRTMSTEIVPCNFNTIHYVIIILTKEQMKIQQKHTSRWDHTHTIYCMCIYLGLRLASVSNHGSRVLGLTKCTIRAYKTHFICMYFLPQHIYHWLRRALYSLSSGYAASETKRRLEERCRVWTITSEI